MKIGIITQPLHTNYGGILQNYALQLVLKRMGHEPITLRESFNSFVLTTSHINFFLHWFKAFMNFLLMRIMNKECSFPKTRRRLIKSMEVTESFIKKNIKFTPSQEFIYPEDVVKLGIQVLIVGSDQVWRPSYERHLLRHQFLGFAENLEIRRIAYAASFGSDIWEYTDKEEQESRRLVKKFDAVSVREYDGLAICKTHWGIDAQWVLDPVMLLTRQDYENLIQKVPVSCEKFVFAYIVSEVEETKYLAQEIALHLGCYVRYMYARAGNDKQSVEQWIANFRDSIWVITDSFHGAVFSLLFEKQFLCFVNHTTGNSRMNSIKRLTGLDDRFIEGKVEMPKKEINYNAIMTRIDAMRKYSLNYLTKVLE